MIFELGFRSYKRFESEFINYFWLIKPKLCTIPCESLLNR